MATKTKKQAVKAASIKAQKPIVPTREPFLKQSDILPLSLIFLYLFVDFVPNMGSADVMGAQWVYLVIINILSAVYIYFDRKNSSVAISRISRNIVSILFISLFILSGLSILAAMNKVESFVCYARYSATFVSFFSIAVLLFNRPNLFKILAQVLSVFLLIGSIDILRQFFSGLGNTTLGDLIFNLKGNSGNKNIMAASLVLKIPFAAFCIYSFNTIGKVINLLIVALAALAVFFINARASYLSLILVTILFIAYCAYEYLKNKDLKLAGKRIGLFFLPLVVSWIISTIIIDNQLKLETADSSYGYGSVTERLSTISFTKEGSNLRMYQWLSAIDYIKHHPAMGAGFGNWKLASIPYEKTFSDEMYITYHVHNDFLETTAEMGLLGGLLYLGIYLAVLLLVFKVVFSKANEYYKQIAVFTLMAFSVYFVDAMFNFPLERPIMQIFLASILAFTINAYLLTKSKEQSASIKPFKYAPAVFAVLVLALMIPAYYITHETYKSMVAQNKYNQDMLSGKPVYHAAEVLPAFPSIPNLNVFGFPIDAIKARYLLADKKYDEALAYLNGSMHVDPYITYNEFLKANIFLETGKLDSAKFYAEKCFFMKPRAKSNYTVLNAVLYQTKDSALGTKAFKEATKYRSEPWIYSDYINLMYALGKDYKSLFLCADSAAKKFPNDADLKKKQKELGQLQNITR
ncbi:MAG: O-antigen ligase family protein [Candidatus Dadabacteria bacterium]